MRKSGRRILCVRVHPSISIDADTRCQGLQKLHANTHKPVKATKKRSLIPEQKRANHQINSQRSVVEHAIRRLKVFRLRGERYRNRRRRFGPPLATDKKCFTRSNELC